MTNSTNLDLPFIAPAQAQKHVTHNEAIRALDAIVQLSILDRDLAVPPVTPQEGDRYIVAASASGDWAGRETHVAAWQDGAWQFYTPQEGWLAWIGDEDVLVAWDGSAWSGVSGGGGGSVNPVSLVGVNATADTTNRLSVASSATLLNHVGNGHQLKLNKNAVADTASLLYQTGFSGRAELGLTGDDDFHFKVSADGSAWSEAIVIDKDSGEVTFPNTAIGGSFPLLVVNRNGTNQTGLTPAAFNKVEFTNEIIDSEGWFDNATNYRYTPLEAGWYEVTLSVRTATGTSGESPQAGIYKNGSIVAASNYMSGTGASAFATIVTFTVQMNGSTDYIEGYAYLPATITTLAGSVIGTFMTITRVR